MELVERTPEITQLLALLAPAAAGRGSLVLLGGEAGVGKTSLVRAVVAAAGPARVLWGACDAMAPPRPLGPVLDFAEDAGHGLAGLLQSLAPREQLFQALIKSLRSGAGVTLVVLEDLHWGDQATFDLVRFLGRRLNRLPVLIVVTYRAEELGPRHPLTLVMGDLATAGNVVRVRLDPLSVTAVATLAPAWDAAELHRRTGGNPFFVKEVLAAGPGPVPASVRDAVLARVARLSSQARRALEAGVILAPRIPPEVLQTCAGVDRSAIEECEDAGFLVRAGGTLEFRHALACEALHASMPAKVRAAWHGITLAILIQRGLGGLATRAHHAEEAEDPAGVLAFAPAAAREAAALHAHREAAAQYARALRFSAGLPAAARASLLEARAYECYLIDRIQDALECRRAALALRQEAEEPAAAGDNLRWLSRLSWFLGRKADADRLAREAVTALEALPPGRELAMAWSNLAQLSMLEGCDAEAVRHGEAAIGLARALGDREIEAHALNNVGACRARMAGGASWSELEASLRLALEAGLEEHIARAYTNLATEAFSLGDLGRGEQWLGAGLAYAGAHDLDAWTLYLLGLRSLAELRRGRWDAAAETAGEVLRQPEVSPVSRIQALVALGTVRARRGDPDGAGLLDEALRLALPSAEMRRIGPVRAARAEAAWLAGEPLFTADEAQVAGPCAGATAGAWLLGELTFWEGRARTGREVPPGAAPPWRALLAGDALAAARMFRQGGYPYEAAIALWASGQAGAAREAQEVFERLGAHPAAATAARTLRALGGRDRPRLPRASTRASQGGLTTREREVLDLLANGMRNAEIAARLFVSAKTVDHHVSAILAKIGARTRTEAAHWHAGNPGGEAVFGGSGT